MPSLFTLFVIALSALILWSIFGARPLTELTGFTTYLDDFQISGKEFLDFVRKELERRKLPVKMDIPVMFEHGIMSAPREYLRIVYEYSEIGVCSGHFGTGSYVSWHFFFREPTKFSNTRWLKWLATLRGKNPDMQSFHQVDTMASLQATVRDVVAEYVQALVQENGIRSSRGVESLRSKKK